VRERRLSYRPGELGAAKAAELLGVTRRTVLRWLEQGHRGVRCPSRRTGGGQYRVDRGELLAWAHARGLRVER